MTEIFILIVYIEQRINIAINIVHVNVFPKLLNVVDRSVPFHVLSKKQKRKSKFEINFLLYEHRQFHW